MTSDAAPRPDRERRRRRCRRGAGGCVPLALLLLLPLLWLDGPGRWATAWLLGLPALVGLVGAGLAAAGRSLPLLGLNLLCGVLSVPVLLVVLTLVLGP
ncbi:hypothetical protein DT076_08040 [Desertihabitans brevis]|uniref:Uncharacterized protein n=1 Tax=Desertihabitans brevis TaxID=2268447 RepID=A0A367YVQ2_9ACTN|nr:hypothetical protein [Desertihabitans brevis]RCK69953.1 hypothetical protein DT076_08040 [Desertihabitans brevis]